jgi:hypothetical protein
MNKKEARQRLHRIIRPDIKACRKKLRQLESEEKKLLKTSKKMKPGGGRNKGNAFEVLVAKKIVHAFAKAGFKFDNTDCYRTPSSGGHRYAKHDDPGDLVISPRLLKAFPFSVECKDQKSLELYRFFIPFARHKSSWPEHQFLDQTIAAAELKHGLSPMLVFKKDSKVFCAFPSPIMSWPPSLTFIYKNVNSHKDSQHWQLMLFSRFLKRHGELMARLKVSDKDIKKDKKAMNKRATDGDYAKLANFIMHGRHKV